MNHREVMQQALDAIGSAYREHFVHTQGSTKNELQDAANALRAELAKPAAGPEGWVMVPKEPTPEMCAVFPAYDGSTYSNGFDSQDFADNYRAMLAAAPQPPAPVVDEGRHPLDCLHINRGSLDAAADAYEAEFDNAKCREAFDNRYHKIKAAVSYDEWQAIWFKALEHERRKTAPAVSPVDVEAVREVIDDLTAVNRALWSDEVHLFADQLARAIGDEK